MMENIAMVIMGMCAMPKRHAGTQNIVIPHVAGHKKQYHQDLAGGNCNVKYILDAISKNLIQL